MTTAGDPELETLISEVEGPGLEVELMDAPIPANGVPDGYTADDYVVHEQDVQAVINALWAGGADAIAVMDQRIIATSAVRCVGSTLLLHGQVHVPPYTVTAVGPADRMRRALDASPASGCTGSTSTCSVWGSRSVSPTRSRCPPTRGRWPPATRRWWSERSPTRHRGAG